MNDDRIHAAHAGTPIPGVRRRQTMANPAQGRMVGAFQTAAFALGVGEDGDAAATSFGRHPNRPAG